MTLALRCSLLQPIIQQQSPKSIANYQPMSSNTLYNMLETGSFTNVSYNEVVAQTSGIWTAVAVITFIIYLILLTNAIWMRRCPHRASGIWAWCRLTKSQKNITNFLVVGLVLCTIALGASIKGTMIGGSNKENGNKAACALIDFFGRVKNGSISDNWGGAEKSLLSYQTLAARFSTEVQGISATFSTDSSQMDSKIVEYQNDLLTLEKNRGNYKVKSARYGSASSVETDFIHELLPMSKTGTHLNSLKAESNKISSVIKNSAQGLKTEVPNLKSKVANYQISATKAADNYKTFIQPVSMASQSIADYVTENYDAWTEVNTGVLVLFYINMALLTTLLASTLYRDKTRSQLAVKLAYISWNCLMILNVVNAILASHMQILKKHSLEHCDVFNLVAKDPKYIEALTKQYTPESTAALKLCFFGNGDTYSAVGFSEAGQKLGKIGTYIRDIEPYLVNGPGSKEITAQKAIIDLYIQGLILPSSDQKSEESTITNLNLLNSYSNSIPSGNKQTGLAHCSISKDMWVLNLANCATKRWIAAYEPYDNFGDSICLGILSLDSGNINERYKDSNFPGCGLVQGDKIADILVNQYHGLNAHFEDARIKFMQLKRFYENNLELKYNETLKAASTITQSIHDFNTSFSGLLQYATSPEDGILYNSNCSFFRSGLRQTNSFLCEAATSIDTTLTVQIISIVCGTLGCVLMYLYLRKLEATFKLIKDDEDSDWEKRGPKEMHRLDASNQEDNDQF